ncbi:MAG: cytochrome c [Rhodobacteraceae bacterium]|nr:cytochrome c [Paracoccaceae bacterium]
MNAKIWMTALVASSVSLAALAHSGATGVVKERMDAMGELSEAMKLLTPMMRGQAEYNPDAVRRAADTMIDHAGSDMTELFPEGSNDMPSEALDVIWEDWEEFAALAEALRTSAEGMKLAADNGLMGPGDMPGQDMMGSGQGMMGAGQGMMGTGQGMMGAGQGMMGTGQGMMGGAPTQMMSSQMLAEMPVNAGFMAVTQTCSACHQKFRAEEK